MWARRGVCREQRCWRRARGLGEHGRQGPRLAPSCAFTFDRGWLCTKTTKARLCGRKNVFTFICIQSCCHRSDKSEVHLRSVFWSERFTLGCSFQFLRRRSTADDGFGRFPSMDWKYWIYFWITALIRLQSVVTGTAVWEDRVRFLREPNERLTINAGSDVELPCLAVDGTSNSSGRRLSVRWMRNGVLADDLTSRSNGSLILRNVQIEQEAIYQCAVLSTRYGVVLSQRANLTVSKITNFTEEPQDATVSIGGTARFQCVVAATSVPSVAVTWFHNDLPLINDVERIRILASGILQIANVRQADEGPYHCVASNVAGNITSRTATLTTSIDSLMGISDQNLPIRVLKAPSNVSVVGDQAAIFECLFEGVDNVIWKKVDDSPVSSKAYRIGSNLIIDHVSNWDEGAYACVGSRAAAKPVTLIAHLAVDSPPVIRKPPEEKLSRRGEWWRFHCDTASKPAPEIVWYKDGEKLRSHGRVKIFPSEDQPPARLEKPSGEIHYGRDLLVSSIQAEDVGIYQCFSSNYLGTVSAGAALSYIELDLEGPANLTASVLPNQRELALAWQPPSVMGEQYHLTVYIVHFHESEAGSENTVAVQQDACLGGVCRTICCSNVDLVPHTNYTFWVDALVVYQGEPLFTRTSDPVLVTSGDAVSLTVAPLVLQETLDASRIRLSWTAPAIQDLRGQLVEYRLDIKETSADDGMDTIRPSISLPKMTTNYEADGLVPGTVVYFRVIPRTRAGFPELLPEKTYPWLRYKPRAVNSSENAPSAPIIEANALNSTSIIVQWKSTSRISASKWIISVAKSSDGSRIARSDIDGALNSVVLIGLGSDTLHQVSVAAVSISGAEGLAASRLVKTSATISPPIISIPPASEPVIPFPTPSCQVAGPAKMKVSWNTPMMKIAKYALRYSLLPDDNEPLNVSAYVKQIETTSNFIIFTDLIPGRSYLFAARAENSDGYKSAFSDDITCFVPMTKPPPPTDVEVSVVNGSSLLITWAPSPVSDGMGDILLYHVRYSTNLVDPMKWKEIIVNSSNTSVYLSNLNSSAVYFVSVSAENEAGRGAESTTRAANMGSMANSDLTGNPPTTVIFQTSYKEGIIIGVCIALVCAAVCAAVIIFRSRREHHSCIGYFAPRRRSTAAKSPSSHAPNGQCGGERRIELAEIQTLLPRLIENVESDTKGGNGYGGPRGYPVSRANFSLPPPPNNVAETAFVETTQPHSELLTVSVQSPCMESEQQREQSSDLSHSPATGSSLGSWVHSNNGELVNGILQKHHHGSISMPNLFDSGIGFDDLSTSMPFHGRYLPFPISGSPRRDCTLLVNGEAAVDSVTLPGCGPVGNGAVENAYLHYQKNGKKKRLRELLIPQQSQEATGGRAATALGPLGSLLSTSRATSQCTC